MSEIAVTLQELKAHLRKYLRRVRQGHSVLIMDQGKLIGRIVPAEQPLADQIQEMAAAGTLLWSGQPLQLVEPVAQPRGSRCVADLLIRNRS